MASLGRAPWTGPAPRAVVYYFLLCAASAPVFVPLAAPRLRPRAVADLLRVEGARVLGSAVVSFVSYGLVLQALRTAPVSYVVAARQTSVLFAVGLGVAWLRETPGRPRLVGAAATVAGVVLIARA
jgi:drug/metabolite transporter (DMT)-like permease